MRTAKELISHLHLSRARAVESRDMLTFLADQVYTAHLKDGQRLLDATDFKAWLLELAAATTVNGQSFDNIRNRSVQDTCPRCGHIHIGDSECGEDMGGGRICRCELSVPA